MDQAIRNATVGHSSNVPVQDRYIYLTDEKLLEAFETMKLDHGSNPGGVGEAEKSHESHTKDDDAKEKMSTAYDSGKDLAEKARSKVSDAASKVKKAVDAGVESARKKMDTGKGK